MSIKTLTLPYTLYMVTQLSGFKPTMDAWGAGRQPICGGCLKQCELTM